MEREVEEFCKVCYGCQLVSKANPPEPIITSQLDFLGPLPTGHSVLVVID